MDVSAARDLQLNVIMSPVGPYFKEGFKPIKLLADTDHVRAWPGGAAAHKIGAYVPSLNQNDDPRNYAPTIHAQSLAAKRGYNSILWLLNDKVTEAGTMNLFCLWRNHDNQVELITAPLDGLFPIFELFSLEQVAFCLASPDALLSTWPRNGMNLK